MAENNNMTAINASNDIIKQYQLESLNLQSPNIGKDINERFESINKNFAKIVGSEYLKGAKGDSIVTKKITLSKVKDLNNIDGHKYYIMLVDLITSTLSPEDKLNLFIVPAQRSTDYSSVLREDGRFKDLTNVELNPDQVGNRFDNLDKAEFTLVYEVIEGVQNEEILTCLPFTFKDPWFGEITKNIDADKNTGSNVDLSCIICYDIIGYDSNNSPIRDFIRSSMIPTIHYEGNDKRFNWIINGVETGLAAEGPQGKKGDKGTGLLLAEYVVKKSTGDDGKEISSHIITRFHYHVDNDTKPDQSASQNDNDDWITVYDDVNEKFVTSSIPEELKYNLVNNCVVFAVLKNTQQDPNCICDTKSVTPQNDSACECQSNTEYWIWGLLHVDNSAGNPSEIVYKIREGGKVSDIIGVGTHTLLSLMRRNRYNFIPYYDSYNVAEKTDEVSNYDGHVLYSSTNLKWQGSGEEATAVKIRPSDCDDVLNIGPSKNSKQSILNSEYKDNFFNKISIGEGSEDTNQSKYIVFNDTIEVLEGPDKVKNIYTSKFPTPVAGIMQYAKRLVGDNHQVIAFGSSSKPVYFADGRPSACGDTLDVNITGTAPIADHAMSLSFSGTNGPEGYDVGDSDTPVYFEGGVPKACLAIDVPTHQSLYVGKMVEIEDVEQEINGKKIPFTVPKLEDCKPVRMGSINKPIYFNDGRPELCSNTLDVHVLGNAKSSTYSSKMATITIAKETDPDSPVQVTPQLISIGSDTNPVYFKEGVPVKCGTSLDVNISKNAATATALQSSAGSATNPVYFKYGKPVKCDGTLGVSITGNAGSATKLTIGTAGSATMPVYFQGGNPVAITSYEGNAASATKLTTNAGSTIKPVYFSGGVPVAVGDNLDVNISRNAATATKLRLTGNIGSASKPIYFSNGSPVACADKLEVSITGNAATATSASQLMSKTRSAVNAGDDGHPVYFENGVPKECTTLKVSLDGNASSATRLNIDGSVGSATKPVYFSDGIPVAITSYEGNAASATKLTTSAGSVTRPVYFKDGKPVELPISNSLPYNISGNAATATKLTIGNIGSTTRPVYFKDGKPVQCSDTISVGISGNAATATKLTIGNIGSDTKPVYFKDGKPVELPTKNSLPYSITGNAASATKLTTTNVGSATKPVYFKDGKPVQCADTISVGISGNAASATKLTTNAGTSTKPVYFKDGKPVAITSYEGNAATATKLTTSNVGSATKPVYFKDGKPVQCSDTINVGISGHASTASKLFAVGTGLVKEGDWMHPVYFKDGMPTECGQTLDVSVTGNAATADKLNTPDASRGLVGSSKVPVYFSNGLPKKCEDTLSVNISKNAATATRLTIGNIGSTTKPVYFKDGIPVELPSTNPLPYSITGNAGTATRLNLTGITGNPTRPVYFKDGKPVVCDGTLGVSVTGNAATATALQSSAGSTTKPVYFKNGKPVVCDGTLGVSVTGNAATATKLATARNISISKGVTGTATAFSGAANIDIPVTSINENYITWGGGKQQVVGPMDMATCNYLNANRLSFLPAKYIKVYYSNDGDSSLAPLWKDYGLTDAQKTSLVTTDLGTSLYPGKKSNGTQAPKKDLLRVEITAENGNLYFSLKKIMLQISTNGASGCYVIVEKKMNGSTSFTNIGKYAIAGWSGWNAITCNSLMGGSSTSSINTVRLTFGFDSYYSGYNNTNTKFCIMKIAMHGENCWTNKNSQLAETGNLYSWDANGAAYFPSNVDAPIVTTDKLICDNIDGDKITAKNIEAESSNSKIGKTGEPWDTVYTKNLMEVNNAEIDNVKITNAEITNATIKNITGLDFGHVFIQEKFPTLPSRTSQSIKYTITNTPHWWGPNKDLPDGQWHDAGVISKIKLTTSTLPAMQDNVIDITLPTMYIPVGLTYVNDYTTVTWISGYERVKVKDGWWFFDKYEDRPVYSSAKCWAPVEVGNLQATITYKSGGKTKTITKDLPVIKTTTYQEYNESKRHITVAYPKIDSITLDDVVLEKVSPANNTNPYKDLEISIKFTYSAWRWRGDDYKNCTRTRIGHIYTPGVKMTTSAPSTYQSKFEVTGSSQPTTTLSGKISMTNNATVSGAYIPQGGTGSAIYLTKQGIRIQSGSSYVDFVSPKNNGAENSDSIGYVEAGVLNSSTGEFKTWKKHWNKILS